MHKHRYSTRSKASKAQLNAVATNSQDQSSTTLAEMAATKPATAGVQDPTNPQTAEAAAEEELPRLFTLPPELQTIIYKQKLLDSSTIHLRVFIGNRTDKETRWQVDTRINGRRISKPSVLAVCKYLRNFVMPLYVAGHTFSAHPSEYDEILKMQVIHNMWGEHTKHIRCIEYWAKWGIRYISEEPWSQGLTKVETIPIVVTMKLLAGGTLVLSRRSSGTHGSGNLPEGEMCHCDLDRFAATSSLKGNDQRRLVEIMAHCATFDLADASAKVCSCFNRPCLADIKRFDRE